MRQVPLLVEAGWGGLVQYPWSITWTDISRYVDTNKQGVSIARGASDELSETQPGTATLRLDNQDARFTPGNPASPYYPYVRRNAPVRVSVAVMPTRSGVAPYPMAMLGDDFDDDRLSPTLWTSSGGVLEQNGVARVPVSTAGDANLVSARTWKLTGSKLTAKLARVPAAGGSSNAAASMWVTSTTSGTRLGWRYDALTGVLAAMNQVSFFDGTPTNLTYSAIDHAWLRIRESGGTVYWETSNDGFIWTVRRTLATPAWVGAQTQAAEFPATRTGGTSDYIEWDLVGAEVRPRFYGMVNQFPVDWEGLVSTVTVTCTDLFKRLNRLPALRSMLAQEILHQDVPGVGDTVSAYYPLTEPSGSAAAGDISGGGCGALAVTQLGSGGALEFGAEGLADTGDTSVAFTPASASQGKYLTGDLGAVFEANSAAYAQTVEVWIKTTTAGRVILGMYETTLDHQYVLALNASGELVIEHTEAGGTLTVYNSARVLNDGAWHHIVHDGYGSKRLYIDGVAAPFTLSVVNTTALRTLHIGGYRGARLFNGQIAHVAISHVTGNIGATISADHYTAATTGYAGEAADDRIVRLARYAGLSSVTVLGATHDPIASQGPGGSSVVARMREVEATESARLFAERDYYGLAYQSRDVRYNPDPSSEVFTINYADLETKGVQLSDDDQKLVNIVEASRPGGATQRVTAPQSILAFGEYEQSLSVLKTTDNSVLDAAYWLVSRYANPGPELREVPIEAHTMPNYLDILDADISSYFSVYNLPAQAPAPSLRVTVEGYTETIKEQSHLIQFHTSASVNDSVWVLDDAVYSVLDSTTRLAYAETLSALALTSAFLGAQSVALAALPAAAGVLLAVLGPRVSSRARRALRLRTREVSSPELGPIALGAPPLPARVTLAERLARVTRRARRASRIADR
ncbi:LamG domain-containing protein [Streptomyces sp. NPDC017943]|uniref:LamG domain-containing protein n=1 Tax=Streptomyces sp. NPDC017943 TaxID=3365019 RepID=UPI00379E926C